MYVIVFLKKTRFVKETECPYNIATVSFTAAAWKYESLFLPLLCPLPLADCVLTVSVRCPLLGESLRTTVSQYVLRRAPTNFEGISISFFTASYTSA